MRVGELPFVLSLSKDNLGRYVHFDKLSANGMGQVQSFSREGEGCKDLAAWLLSRSWMRVFCASEDRTPSSNAA
ncbi:hypothetical protein AZE99_06005 [Sphingorhabdus sp. M41]|nr:hypothetical protein AZE99_06005 [Sphingorhabdus sp. M41]